MRPVNTIGICVIGVHIFHPYGWKTLFHFTEGGLPPSLSDLTQGLNPDPPLRRGVHALVPDAQLAAQVVLKRPLLAPSLSHVLPNRGYRLPHVVKGPPARSRERQFAPPPAQQPPLSVFSLQRFSVSTCVQSARRFRPLTEAILALLSPH
jgi:hypothetical protein